MPDRTERIVPPRPRSVKTRAPFFLLNWSKRFVLQGIKFTQLFGMFILGPLFGAASVTMIFPFMLFLANVFYRSGKGFTFYILGDDSLTRSMTDSPHHRHKFQDY